MYFLRKIMKRVKDSDGIKATKPKWDVITDMAVKRGKEKQRTLLVCV